MAIRLEKPWLPLSDDAIRRLPAQLGVFELGDEAGRILYIGYAGGRSLFGLRGEIERSGAAMPAASRFRSEVTMQYLTRHQELLMLHVADHGAIPEGNRGDALRLGRLSPL
jgi:hypothetical protein